MSLVKHLFITFALLLGFLDLALAEMKITFIDAGQADAAVVQIDQVSGEPFTILVDGGDGDSDLENNLPTILAQDPTIELVVLSHPHRDHTGGLDWLVKESTFVVDRVWWTNENSTEGNYVGFREGIVARQIITARPDEAVYFYPHLPNFELWVVNNGQEFSGTSGPDINNDSLVLQVIYEPTPTVSVTALFTGDIEKAQGKMLVDEWGDELKSDIVKVPHHGSDHLFEKFPEKVAASIAVASSTGTHGNHKHPRKSALDLYDLTADIYCTCDAAETHLDITVTVSNSGGISVTPAQQPPYFAWERNQNGTLQRVVVQ